MLERRIHCLRIGELSDEEKFPLLALQGIVNREGPRVFYITNFWCWKLADERWMKYYQREKGFRFEELKSLEELIEIYQDRIKGLVISDPKVEDTKTIALTIAGLKDYLPLSPKLRRLFRSIPVREDLRGRWKDNLSARQWSCRYLLPRCKKRILYSLQGLWSGLSLDSLDYAIGNRSFIYPLRPGNKDPDELLLMQRIMMRVGPMAALYGWAEPEGEYCKLASSYGNYILCAEAPNLSFHAEVKSDLKEFKQRCHFNKRIKPERKHYLSFMLSEGDSLKGQSTFHGGAWFDIARGKVPINWGFQPLLIDLFPAIAEFYYNSLTENDYFYCGPSGAGYVQPNNLSNKERFFRHTGRYLKRADISVVECWLHFDEQTYRMYSQLSGAQGFTMPCGPSQTVRYVNSTPVFLRGGRLNYFNPRKGPRELIRTIEEVAARLPLPSFLTAFLVPGCRSKFKDEDGFSPSQLREVMEGLDPKRFKVVTLDELTALARQRRK